MIAEMEHAVVGLEDQVENFSKNEEGEKKKDKMDYRKDEKIRWSFPMV